MSQTPPLEALTAALATVMLVDQPALRARLAGLQRRARAGQPIDRGLPALIADIEKSRARCAQRAERLPKPEYLLDLPVVARREDIKTAIEKHQVVIVCGETGSGKTTQLPKICLELGRGVAGLIGHTQPRRIAARSLAVRIAEELHSAIGQAVGFKVRFSDHVGPDTHIKVMTDGILLAETQGDADLLAYDTLIIDEAHERSLNVDFLLGYLARLLPRRPDLKLIITSATIDPQRFSKHFGNAPIIEVSGRTYPVDIRYRPLLTEDEDEQDRDRGQALLAAVDELAHDGPGDMLVFLPGEREIREATELLRKHHPPQTEILPLFGRLSAAQQAEVFKPHSGRRIVLATNVAETSLTVPGIRYVIDTGLARISRYSYRTKVQRLPIEPVSQASANQRAGRCGRLGPGICIRLYSEDDFNTRPAFTEPEILRTNLASVILQMLALKLGDIEDFPFVEPPDARYIRDGFKLLHELGAVDEGDRLTELGRQLARLPVDVRIGRMVLAGRDEHCLREVLVIASALSVPDPRERPMDKQQAADEKHKQFADEQSDFLGFVKLWDFYHEQARHLSQAKLRKLCQTHFISYVRMREWHDIHAQLHGLAVEMGMRLNEVEGGYEPIHRALLAGLLGNIAFKSDANEYTGARGLTLNVFPGSALFKKQPKWIVAAELVETARRYARTVARIEPEWVERLADHLIKRSYTDPHWEKKRGHVVASERTTLYGLVLTPSRKIDYGRVNPIEAREVFIRQALVPGELISKAAFLEHNHTLIEAVLELEAKSRRRDVLVDEELLYRFFDERLPSHVSNGPQFERWYKQATEAERDALKLTRDYLMQHEASGVTAEDFPPQIEVNGLRLALDYHFEPGHVDDGVTVKVPVAALNQLDQRHFDWLVPGLLEDKLVALIKSLPKALRRHFVPAPDFARAARQALVPGKASLLDQFSAQLRRMTAVEVPADAWQLEQLPPHLSMNFHLIDANGKLIARGRDLNALKQQVGAQAVATFERLPTAQYERDKLTDWDCGDLPEFVEIEQQGLTLRGYPALVADKAQINLRLLDSADKAHVAHRAGVLVLFQLRATKSLRYLEKNLPGIQQMCLNYAAAGQCEQLKADLVQRITEAALYPDATVPRDRAAFDTAAARAEQNLIDVGNHICKAVADALAEYHAIQKRIKGAITPAWLAAINDIRDQLDHLIYGGFVLDTHAAQLKHLGRYLKAINKRLDRLQQNPAKDRPLTLQVEPHWQKCKQRLDAARKRGAIPDELQHYRWLIEEFRVSLFAQELGTAEKVSGKRLEEVGRGS
ncbi:MAG: ATP-dependent RNA helicase HrpA [Gammaproteobacteria bacterium]|nr:ATP-dependent RNA helicase HrpA [Gammaproteobacteria bacterium]